DLAIGMFRRVDLFHELDAEPVSRQADAAAGINITVKIACKLRYERIGAAFPAEKARADALGKFLVNQYANISAMLQNAGQGEGGAGARGNHVVIRLVAQARD